MKMKIWIWVFAIVLALTALFAYIHREAQEHHAATCIKRWIGNYGSKWERGIGCLVRTKDGRFIPEKYVKEPTQ